MNLVYSHPFDLPVGGCKDDVCRLGLGCVDRELSLWNGKWST